MKNDKTNINRLILIGNGFDLAHGMKTSYVNFLLDYIVSSFSKVGTATSNIPFKDEVFEIDTGTSYYIFDRLGYDSVADLIVDLYNTGKLSSLFNKESFYKDGKVLRNIFNVRFNMPFVEHLIKNCCTNNWVDIENEFYDELKKIALKETRSINKQEEVNKLNNSLKWLIEKLEEYLTKIGDAAKTNKTYKSVFLSPIDKGDFTDKDLYSHSKLELGDTMILNFNYTSTLERYIDKDAGSKTSINYIHGKLNDKDNPVIFGFGDELDDDYLKLELSKAKGTFEYIKSFWYFKTSNYYNLIRFIEADLYQVYILGHSCGLSDRTMLNMIFEHENCRSIKIFYHGDKVTNNHTSLTQEISRHFKDKKLMRRRIVSFDRSSAMPQHD